MNERIKQLAEQAGLKHHNWITNESNVKDGDFKYPRLEDYEKFAELIVFECTKVIVFGGYRNPALGEKHPLTPPEIATMIKEHFGVE
jgi:hypothetical protein